MSTPDQSYLYPKDIDKWKVTIAGKDVTSMVKQTEVYQDIFSPFWTATIQMTDTQNTIMNQNFKPGDSASILLKTTAPGLEGQKNFKFKVYKIGPRVLIKEQHYGYTMHLISEEFFKDQKKRVNKYYETTPNSIASNIISEFGVGTITESSSSPTPYSVIIPNLSPVSAVEWIARFSQKAGKGADFVFFQSDAGQFKFKSLEDMFGDSSGYTLTNTQKNAREKSGAEYNESYLGIEQYTFVNHLDAVRNTMLGFFGNSSMGMDLMNKTMKTEKYSYGGDGLTEDNTKKPFGDMSGLELSSVDFSPFHSKVYVSQKSHTETFKEWKGSRRSNVLKLETNKMLCAIPGHAKLNEILGKTVNVELPSQQDVKGDIYDKYYRGDWLVSAIRHIVANNEYQIHFELSKKRLNKAIG